MLRAGTLTLRMVRSEQVEAITRSDQVFDLLVIGGGATGLGCAVEAASRGLRVALVEQHDFGKGTSSRSTKLAHGGVRYLQQGHLSLVREALLERARLLRNAPGIVHRQTFVIPGYRWWESPYYRAGLWFYDRLAGVTHAGSGPAFAQSRKLSVAEVGDRLPNLRSEGLRGGVAYEDGQFDDARMCITLLRTLFRLGGNAANYLRVESLIRCGERIEGARVRDMLPGATGSDEATSEHEIRARVVVNAAGPFAASVGALDPTCVLPGIRLSRGIHLVLDRAFLDSDDAVLVPRTDDGRVLFLIPWYDRVLVGTTDTPVSEATLEPEVPALSVAYLLEHAGRYLRRKPGLADVRSQWAGLRPLFDPAGDRKATKSVSREHHVAVSTAGLVSVLGGKWTTYRRMAEDAVRTACGVAGVEFDESHSTADLALEAGDEPETSARWLHPELPYHWGHVRVAVEEEMAMTVEDILARRTRALFLDANAALECAGPVATWLRSRSGTSGDEAAGVRRGRGDAGEKDFRALTRKYMPDGTE